VEGPGGCRTRDDNSSKRMHQSCRPSASPATPPRSRNRVMPVAAASPAVSSVPPPLGVPTDSPGLPREKPGMTADFSDPHSRARARACSTNINLRGAGANALPRRSDGANRIWIRVDADAGATGARHRSANATGCRRFFSSDINRMHN